LITRLHRSKHNPISLATCKELTLPKQPISTEMDVSTGCRFNKGRCGRFLSVCVQVSVQRHQPTGEDSYEHSSSAIAPPYDSDTHPATGVPVPHLLSGVADRQSTESSICWTTVKNMLLVIT